MGCTYWVRSVLLSDWLGHAVAQAVSRLLPTAATSVRAQVRSCGICGRQSSTGAGFLRVLRLPLPILIPPNSPHSSIIRSWYSKPISIRRREWAQSHPILPHETKKKFLEELIAPFSLIRHGPHRKRRLQRLIYRLLNTWTSTVSAHLYWMKRGSNGSRKSGSGDRAV
jgi:hypothetical protein